MRYAYADMAAEHDALVPGYPLGFQPIGIRQIRDGYLYLFHAEAPDILHEYQVRAAARSANASGPAMTPPGTSVPEHRTPRRSWSPAGATSTCCSRRPR